MWCACDVHVMYMWWTCDVNVRTDFTGRGSKVVSWVTGSTLGPSTGPCEYANEPFMFHIIRCISLSDVRLLIFWRKAALYGKLFIGRPCKKRADDLLKLSRHKLKMVVAILTGHAPVRGSCTLWVCLMGIQPADSAGWRLKQCSILRVLIAAMRWLFSVIMSLGSWLPKQET